MSKEAIAELQRLRSILSGTSGLEDDDQEYIEDARKSVDQIIGLLAEQPAQQHVSVTDELVDAYCRAWEQSFTADNPYHTVSMTAEDRKHIEAGLKAVLAEQPAQCAPAADGVCESLDCPNHKPPQQEPGWLTATQRIYLAQAWAMLDDYALDQRLKGNDSFAKGAEASSHEIKMMLSGPQPAQQEPVAWGIIASNTGRICQVELDADKLEDYNPKHIVPLCTIPQPAQRKPLTDEQKNSERYLFLRNNANAEQAQSAWRAAMNNRGSTMDEAVDAAIEAALGITEKS